MCYISDVGDKRMHLDIVFEMFHGDNASCWLTSIISVLFPCEISHPVSGLWHFHEEPDSTVTNEGM